MFFYASNRYFAILREHKVINVVKGTCMLKLLVKLSSAKTEKEKKILLYYLKQHQTEFHKLKRGFASFFLNECLLLQNTHT